jgi:APA family basic amino acid/polyamine antiporter
MMAFFFLTNYLLSFISLFLLRRREPNLPRPYRAWGYPYTTALAVIGSVAFLIEAIREDPTNSYVTLIALACAYPVYRALKFVSNRNPNAQSV